MSLGNISDDSGIMDGYLPMEQININEVTFSMIVEFVGLVII